MGTGAISDMGAIKATSKAATTIITGAVMARVGAGMEARSGEGSVEDSGEDDGINWCTYNDAIKLALVVIQYTCAIRNERMLA